MEHRFTQYAHQMDETLKAIAHKRKLGRIQDWWHTVQHMDAERLYHIQPLATDIHTATRNYPYAESGRLELTVILHDDGRREIWLGYVDEPAQKLLDTTDHILFSLWIDIIDGVGSRCVSYKRDNTSQTIICRNELHGDYANPDTLSLRQAWENTKAWWVQSAVQQQEQERRAKIAQIDQEQAEIRSRSPLPLEDWMYANWTLNDRKYLLNKDPISVKSPAIAPIPTRIGANPSLPTIGHEADSYCDTQLMQEFDEAWKKAVEEHGDAVGVFIEERRGVGTSHYNTVSIATEHAGCQHVLLQTDNPEAFYRWFASFSHHVNPLEFAQRYGWREQETGYKVIWMRRLSGQANPCFLQQQNEFSLIYEIWAGEAFSFLLIEAQKRHNEKLPSWLKTRGKQPATPASQGDAIVP